jgi:hypothetical protein
VRSLRPSWIDDRFRFAASGRYVTDLELALPLSIQARADRIAGSSEADGTFEGSERTEVTTKG